MWPNIRFNNNSKSDINSKQNVSQQTNQTNNNSIDNRMSSMSSLDSIDSKQLLMAANSIRSLFGNNLNNNLLQSISPFDKRLEPDINTKHINVGHERRVIDYESEHFSRIGDNRLTQMPTNFDNRRIESTLDNNETEYHSNESQFFRRENRFYDPTKMPQKSILKKSKDQLSAETSSVLRTNPNNSFHNIEDEDTFLYGCGSQSMKTLPPGIVDLEQRSAPNVERVLSPISLRLKREMESIDWGRRPSPPKQLADWPQSLPNRDLRSSNEQLVQTNSWVDEEENYKRRVRQYMNRSPTPPKSFDDLPNIELRRDRYLPIGDTLSVEMRSRQRNSSPQTRSPLRYRSSSSRKTISPRSSPDLSPKRSRRRSRSISPRSRRSVSPRYKRRRSRSRSSSRSQNRFRRSRSSSRSDSRNRSRRRSRTPISKNETERVVINPLAQPSISPMRPMIPIGPQGMGLMPGFGPRHPMVSPQMYYTNQNMMPFRPMMAGLNLPQNVMTPQTIPQIKPQIRDNFALNNIPLTNTGPQSFPLKKENKLINKKDLLISERSKLREELTDLKKQLERKNDEQKRVQLKDSGKDSYVYKQLEKSITSIKRLIDEQHNKLEKNGKAIHEIEKTKGKESVKKIKPKVTPDSKKKETAISPRTKQDNNEVKKSETTLKETKKSEKDEEEEDERNSRFHYFDSGPHWCKNCDKFFTTMKLYFTHIHTNEHLSKLKDSERNPWKTKESFKENENKINTNKDKLIVASKGIQFIHSVQGFYCELCEEVFVDMSHAETHFKSAKHNRNYTRYTLLHNNYEPKWKSERDKSFTEFKKREREEERERHKREEDDRVSNKLKLAEQINRKDREVKQRIEAMNKNLKVVTELDEMKQLTHKDKKDYNKSPKGTGIRLNLSANKKENESKSFDKSKKESEKSIEKKDHKNPHKIIDKMVNESKKRDHSREKDKEKSENKPKSRSSDESKTDDNSDQMDCSKNDGLLKTSKCYKTPIEGMECIIIDEINCENMDEMESNERLIIDEKSDEKIENNSDQKNTKEITVSVDKKEDTNEIISAQRDDDSVENRMVCENYSESSVEIRDTESTEKDMKSSEIIENVCTEIENTTNDNNSIDAELTEVNNFGSNEDKLESCEVMDKTESNETLNIKLSSEENDKISTNVSEKELKTNQNLKTKSESNKKDVESEQKECDHKNNENSELDSESKNENSNTRESSDEKIVKDSLIDEEQKSSKIFIKGNDLSKNDEKEVITCETDRNEKPEDSNNSTKSLDKSKQIDEMKSEKNSNENTNDDKRGESSKNIVKTERISVEFKEIVDEFEDELEGFDVIDSINDEGIENNEIELIDLSDG